MDIKTNSSIGRTYAAKPTLAQLRKNLEDEIDRQQEALDDEYGGYYPEPYDYVEGSRRLAAMDPRTPAREAAAKKVRFQNNVSTAKRVLRIATGFATGAALGFQGGATGAVSTGVLAGTGNLIVHTHHFDDAGEATAESLGSTAIGAVLGSFGGWFSAVAGGIAGALAADSLPLLAKSK